MVLSILVTYTAVILKLQEDAILFLYVVFLNSSSSRQPLVLKLIETDGPLFVNLFLLCMWSYYLLVMRETTLALMAPPSSSNDSNFVRPHHLLPQSNFICIASYVVPTLKKSKFSV